MTDPRHLPPEYLAKARRWAEAQAENGPILGALRAMVRRGTDSIEERRAAVAALTRLNPEDLADLADSRDFGRVQVQLLLYSAVLGHRLNSDLELAKEEDGGKMVEPQQVSAGMFWARTWCVTDVSKAAEEAQQEVERMNEMSTEELTAKVGELALQAGVSPDVLEEIARQNGMRLEPIEEGAA